MESRARRELFRCVLSLFDSKEVRYYFGFSCKGIVTTTKSKSTTTGNEYLSDTGRQEHERSGDMVPSIVRTTKRGAAA